MAEIEKDRNWDKEMAEVDRLLKKLPYADPHLTGGSQSTTKRTSVSAPRPAGAADRVHPWVRLLLGLLVGIGMTQWPYPHGCGSQLLFYLLGVGAVIAGGLWSSVGSWRRRLGAAHFLSLVLILWGLGLAVGELLPRIGYAKVALPWLCSDVRPPR